MLNEVKFLLQLPSILGEFDLHLLNLVSMRHLLSVESVFRFPEVPFKRVDLLSAETNFILEVGDDLLVLFD